MTMKEALHALEEVKQAIQLAYSSGYSFGKEQSKWKGLTHQQTKDCVQGWDGNDAYVLCQAIEAKLKEKNSGA